MLTSGTLGCLLSAAALAAAAGAEGRALARPLDATGHWLHGDRAARIGRADVAHTGTGLATHWVATLFWAALFEAPSLRSSWRGRPVAGRAARATATAALAAVVDYTITPRRFTPGWELVLSRRGMAFAYLAMAAGFLLAPT